MWQRAGGAGTWKCLCGCKSVPGSAGCLQVTTDTAGSSSFPRREAAPAAGLQQLPHTERLQGTGCSVTVVVWPHSHCSCTDPLVPASSSGVTTHILPAPAGNPNYCSLPWDKIATAESQGQAHLHQDNGTFSLGSSPSSSLLSCHSAAGPLAFFPSPSPHLGVTAFSPTLLPQHQGLHRQSIAPQTPLWEMDKSTRPIPFWSLAF